MDNQLTEFVADNAPPRSFWRGLGQGWRRHCPQCGQATLFTGYVKMASACKACGQNFEPYRADDAPAYFTILATGHVIVPLVLLVEQILRPEYWVHMALWVPATLGMSLSLLPFIKGAVIGAQWALNIQAGELRADDRL